VQRWQLQLRVRAVLELELGLSAPWPLLSPCKRRPALAEARVSACTGPAQESRDRSLHASFAAIPSRDPNLRTATTEARASAQCWRRRGDKRGSEGLMEVVDVRVEELVADEAAPSSPLSPARLSAGFVRAPTQSQVGREGRGTWFAHTAARPPLGWHAAKPHNVITSFPSSASAVCMLICRWTTLRSYQSEVPPLLCRYFSPGQHRADLSRRSP
jgi:hypothetical protein